MPRGLCFFSYVRGRARVLRACWCLAGGLVLAHGAYASDSARLKMVPAQERAAASFRAEVGGAYQLAAVDRIDEQRRREILQVLQQKMSKGMSGKAQPARQLEAIAGYFSQFAQVHQLIMTLAPLKWRLEAVPGRFETQVHGSRLAVDAVVVQFDPLAAVQLKFHRACEGKPAFCFVSPADVLLHELLHVHAILGPDAAMPGVSGVLGGASYPYLHEQRTLLAERNLYAGMRKIDRRPRPLRTEHTGRAVPVACAVCLP